MSKQINITLSISGAEELARELMEASTQKSDALQDKWDKQLCEQALVAIAGAKHCTPLEGFGCNVRWALVEAVKALKDVRGTQEKHWRVPSKGVKVKLVGNYAEPENHFVVGNFYISEGLTFSGSVTEPDLCVILCAGPGQPMGCFPLHMVEPAT